MYNRSAVHLLDARMFKCPLPLLKLKMALADAADEEIIQLLTRDSGSVSDIPAYLASTPHKLIQGGGRTEAGDYEFIIQKMG